MFNDIFDGSKVVFFEMLKKILVKCVSFRKLFKFVKSVNLCDLSFKGVILYMKIILKKGKCGFKVCFEV